MKFGKENLGSILIAVLLFAAVIVWVVLARRPHPPTRPLCQLVFVDESLSMTHPLNEDGRTVQQLGLTFVDELVDSVVPPRSPMQVWAFASRASVRSVWQGAPAGAEDLLPLQEWMRDHPREGEGTFAVPTFAQALEAARAAATRKEDVTVTIVSDAEWDDLSQVAPLVAQLAALPNVKCVTVAPVSIEGDCRSRLEALLLPLGGRVVIGNKTDIEQALARVHGLITR